MQLEYVSGRHAAPADLVVLAGHLGDAHGAAWITALHSARLDTPYTAGRAMVILDFLSPTALGRAGISETRSGQMELPAPSAFFSST
ncbi:MAG: hypothetical protein JWM17_1408 [Actinobacteria bacterium]|nr:hypothetical protein [Actinomycetota bacterium]MCW3043165.1 hypothetical protein [Actinomycetota bacterium]